MAAIPGFAEVENIFVNIFYISVKKIARAVVKKIAY